MSPRPLSVTIIALLLIVTGVLGLVYHIAYFRVGPLPATAAIEFVRALAVIAGAFLLRGADWARWLAIAWIALHVAISFHNGWQQVAFHAVVMALIVYFLTRPASSRYFRGAA